MRNTGPSEASSETDRVRDAVDLSDAARNEAKRGEMPIRTELVKRVKAEIGAGSYLTDEKLNVAIDRLQRYLNG